MNKIKALVVIIIIFIVMISIYLLPNKKYEKIYEVKELSYYVDDSKIFGKVYIPLDGKKTHKTVIMAHGFTSDLDIFTSTAKYLTEKGYLCYTFDFRGGNFKGRSSLSFSEMTPLTEKRDLETVIDSLSKEEFVDKDNIYFLGESMGSLIGAITIPKYNDLIKASIFYYPAFNMPEMAKNAKKINDNYYILGNIVTEEFIETLKKLTPFEDIKNYNNDIYILHGDLDTIVPLSISKKIEEENYNVILDVIKNEGHGFKEENIKKINELVFRFLER